MPASLGGDRSPTLSLPDRYETITRRLRAAAERSHRPAESVVFLGVTKTVAPETINAVLALGLRDVGENRIQEAAAKRPLIHATGAVRHHFLGHLQTNKARRAVELFDVIQSVDGPRLAETLDRVAGEMGKRQRCLVEVKIAPEASKSGLPPADAGDFVAGFKRYSHLSLEGFMTIGPLDATTEQTRAAFRTVAALFEKRRENFGERPILSMGMSDDFEIAVEEGSTMVRIGRALFGERH